MRAADFTNRVKVQTNALPKDLPEAEINETARGIAFYFKNNEFMYQTFFAKPLLGEINWLEGLDTSGEVYFREIDLIGPNLFHLRLVGHEDAIHKMCKGPQIYNLLRGIQKTYDEKVRSKRFLDTTLGLDRWSVIMSLDKKAYCICNYVKLNNKKTRIHNILVVGDRLLGLTTEGKMITGHLTPDLLDKKDLLLDVELFEEANRIGKIDLLEPVPNSDDCFLITIKNRIYQLNIWGDVVLFDTMDESVKEIKSINFNNARSILATDKGIFEVDVVEMPNMVKSASLPRQIVNNHLREGFKTAMYVEDPHILGVSPAVGIFAKTDDEKVVFF